MEMARVSPARRLQISLKLFENPVPLFRWNRVLLSTTMRTARGQSSSDQLIF